MPNVIEVLSSLLLKNLNDDDKAALEAAISEKLSSEIAALVKQRDEAKAEAEKKLAWLDNVHAQFERVQAQLKERDPL